MQRRTLGPAGATRLAMVGTALLALLPTATPTFASGHESVAAQPVLLSGDEHSVALIMGGSGVPIPSPDYLDDVNALYLHCDPPACTPQGLSTPEGLYPFFGVKELTFDTSLAQGVTILTEALEQHLAEGNHVTVFGTSQSADIASVVMANIVNGSAGIRPAPDQLSFVLSGNEMNPNGGALARFDLPLGSSPSFPSFGITFLGATPVTDYPTASYTGEYDGFADFPRYPLNFVSDLNALLGIVFVHAAGPTADQLANAVEVPTSAGYHGDSSYYIFPTENLPLLDPLRSIPGVGPVLADLIQPDLRVLVNLGYGDPDYGWVNADADVPTPVGLFPSGNDLAKVPGLLVGGTQQGIEKAIGDIAAGLRDPAQFFSLANNPVVNLLQNGLVGIALSGGDAGGSIINALSTAAAQAYSALLPAADAGNAFLTSIPAYDANVVFSELAGGNLLGAIGLPIAADIGLLSFLGGFAFSAVGEGLANAVLAALSPVVDVANLLS